MSEVSTANNGVAAALVSTSSSNKPKRERKLTSLRAGASAAEMADTSYHGKVDRAATDWSQLRNYEVFSLSPDGSFPMARISRSKAFYLATREVILVGSGSVYRVSLSNH